MQHILPYPKDFILSNLLQFSISSFPITSSLIFDMLDLAPQSEMPSN